MTCLNRPRFRVIAAFACAIVAGTKSRNPLGWGILGLFFSIATLIAVTIIPARSDATTEAAEVLHQHEQLVTWVYAQQKPGMLRNNTYWPLFHRKRGNAMIALGVLLIIPGLVLPALIPTFAYAHLMVVVGAILLVVGLALMLAGRMGSPVGGRPHYY